jgi:subtilisin-like proprotein convertase family protein
MGGRGVGFIALCLVVGALTASSAGAATFTNPTPITTPSSGTSVATPYPSTISVDALAGTTVKVRVTLNDIVAAAKDLDVLLKGPGGSTMLFSDLCESGSTFPDLIHLTYTFDDDAAAALPSTCTGPPPSGAYKPSNYDTLDNFPGNPPPYPVGLSNFRGVSPNGSWQLFVFDDQPADNSSIGGWSLELTTTGAASTPAKKKCKKHKRRSASAAKKRCKKKR